MKHYGYNWFTWKYVKRTTTTPNSSPFTENCCFLGPRWSPRLNKNYVESWQIPPDATSHKASRQWKCPFLPYVSVMSVPVAPGQMPDFHTLRTSYLFVRIGRWEKLHVIARWWELSSHLTTWGNSSLSWWTLFVIYMRYNQPLVCFIPTVIGSSIQCMYVPLLRGFGWHFAVLNHRTIPKYSMDWTVVKNMLGQLKVVMSGSQTVLLPSCSDGKSSSQ